MGRIAGPLPGRLLYPSEGFELLEDPEDIATLDTAHGPVAALYVSVRHNRELVGQNIAGDGGQPVMVV
jgi:hypothetical protein